jgi:hypothetical protein
MILSLLLSLGLLGLAAVDPVGIVAMPILLGQKNPFTRSLVFLLGSFVALFIMGFAFSKGLGTVVLGFQATYPWVVPVIEAIAGLSLLIFAGYVIMTLKKAHHSTGLSGRIMSKLYLGYWQLFIVGAILVTVQSLIDVVFVVAMIKVEALHLSDPVLLASVGTYAIAALAIQIVIVIVFSFTRHDRRTEMLYRIHHLALRHTNRILIAASILIGVGLLLNSILTAAGTVHL